MLEHKCGSGCLPGWRDGIEFLLFDNNHIHDYGQLHYIETDLSEEDVMLKTGMVQSKSKLKILKKQGSITVKSTVVGLELHRQIRFGQRCLVILDSVPEAKMVKVGQRGEPDYFVVSEQQQMEEQK